MPKKYSQMAKLKINHLNETVVAHLVKGLTDGKTLKEIREELKMKGIKPSSERTIDLYLSEIRERNRCKTTEQLMYLLGKGMKLKINDQ